MHNTFGDLIRDLIEVCVDDIVVKIKSRAWLLDKLALVFDKLRSMRIKLNSDKYVRFELSLSIVWIFSGLASIPRYETRKPSSLPTVTPLVYL
jgi:hypothetical protein